MTSTRPRRSSHARPSDDELLDAARSTNTERGYRATTMSAVAERADSTKPTLYAHFGDKDALYLRLLEREADACRAVLFAASEANAGLDLAEQVAADTFAFFDYAAAQPDGVRLLFREDASRDSLEVRERLVADIDAQVADRVRNYLVRHGIRSHGDVGQLAAMLVGVALNSARYALDTGADLSAAAHLAAAFSTAALRGLAGL